MFNICSTARCEFSCFFLRFYGEGYLNQKFPADFVRSDFLDWPMSNEKNPGWLGYIRDEKLPSYIGTIINHYKDPRIPINQPV